MCNVSFLLKIKILEYILILVDNNGMEKTLILIPSYEPDELLVNTINGLKEHNYDIMLVNDGSSKKYDEIFSLVEDKVSFYYSYQKNKGKGYALKYAYRQIKNNKLDYDFIITMDGDGQHSINDVLKIDALLHENDELVFGVRSFSKDVPFRSRFGNDFSKVTRSLLTKTYIRDDQCGLRGFPIRYLDELIKIVGRRYEYEMNQIVQFQIKQYPIITTPIETIYLDKNSRSHFSPFFDTFRIQCIIFLNGIPSVLCSALLLMSLLLMSVYDFSSYSQIALISFTWTFSLYHALITVIYPSLSYFRRLSKELLFGAIRLSGYFLSVTFLHAILHIYLPISVILSFLFAMSLNVFFSWVLRKVFRTF